MVYSLKTFVMNRKQRRKMFKMQASGEKTVAKSSMIVMFCYDDFDKGGKEECRSK